MGASAFGGSFAPSVQFEKWEIHKVFPPFSNFQLEQNPSPKALAPLCGVALNIPKESLRHPTERFGISKAFDLCSEKIHRIEKKFLTKGDGGGSI